MAALEPGIPRYSFSFLAQALPIKGPVDGESWENSTRMVSSLTSIRHPAAGEEGGESRGAGSCRLPAARPAGIPGAPNSSRLEFGLYIQRERVAQRNPRHCGVLRGEREVWPPPHQGGENPLFFLKTRLGRAEPGHRRARGRRVPGASGGAPGLAGQCRVTRAGTAPCRDKDISGLAF